MTEGQFDRECERCGCHLTENVTDKEHEDLCPKGSKVLFGIPDSVLDDAEIAFIQSGGVGYLDYKVLVKWAREEERKRCAKIASELQPLMTFEGIYDARTLMECEVAHGKRIAAKIQEEGA